jgi:decaprenylphospho-beta-D-erythro-pentofuranosid-2-ulose 2-reductase
MMNAEKVVLVVGATSDIGRAVALAYATAGWNVQLAGRNPEAIEREAEDIRVRSGRSVSVHLFDVLDGGHQKDFLDGLPVLPHTVVCVVGELGDQLRAQADLDHARMLIRTNFEGPALLLGLVGALFAARGSGHIVGVSSVAGDRGRRSNYVYGSAKAGFTAFMSGLRNRLHPAGVRVITVKPGFVRTRMTAGMKLPPLLTAEPQEVAKVILAVEQGKVRSDVLYVRSLWWPLMLVIRAIPEPLFKRLGL